MDAITALITRVSAPKLEQPAPNDSVLSKIKMAALRAADHALLRPWRFLVIEKKGLQRLGEIFVEVALEKDPHLSPTELDKIRAKPQRAPMLLVAVASIKEHPKVPEIEQLLSTGAAVQNILNAAFALGIGAIWRTGGIAYQPSLANKLGLKENEKIVGFIYLGTPAAALKQAPTLDPAEFFVTWE